MKYNEILKELEKRNDYISKDEKLEIYEFLELQKRKNELNKEINAINQKIKGSNLYILNGFIYCLLLEIINNKDIEL